MTIHATDSNVDAVTEAALGLAAAPRRGICHAFEGGTDNYFTVIVPGYAD